MLLIKMISKTMQTIGKPNGSNLISNVSSVYIVCETQRMLSNVNFSWIFVFECIIYKINPNKLATNLMDKSNLLSLYMNV